MAEANKSKLSNALMVLREEKFGQAYAATLPVSMRRYMPIDKAVNIIGRAMQKTPKLLTCDIKSIQQAMIDCAALGLELAGPLHQAHLVPFWNSKKGKSDAVLIIGFEGYLHLMSNTDKFDGAPIVQWVYDKDNYELNIAAKEPLKHVPNLEGDRGVPLFVYFLVWFKSGGRYFNFKTYDQIIEHRNRYVKKDKNNNWPGPWDEVKNPSEFLEMGKKTMIRLSQKHLPKSTEMAQAVEYEASMERGTPQPIVQWADPPEGDNGEPPPSRAEQVKKALEAGGGGASTPPVDPQSEAPPEDPTPPAEETPPEPAATQAEDNPPPSGGMWEKNVDELEDMPIEVIKEQAIKAGLSEDTFIELKEKVGIRDGARGGNTEAKRKKLIFEIRMYLDTM
jgi:recombination protein RecT